MGGTAVKKWHKIKNTAAGGYEIRGECEILSPNTKKRSEGYTYCGQSLTVALTGLTGKISFHSVK
jgi:hypothetical protein